MRKYTYINKKTGQRVYSDEPLKSTSLKLVSAIRGSVPQGIEKHKTVKLTDRDNLALDGVII